MAAESAEIVVRDKHAVLVTGTPGAVAADVDPASQVHLSASLFVGDTHRPLPAGVAWRQLVITGVERHVQPLAQSLLGTGTKSPKYIKGVTASGTPVLVAAGLQGDPGPLRTAPRSMSAPLALWVGTLAPHTRKRARSGAGTPPQQASCGGTHPAVAVLRDVAFTAACMTLANDLARHRPYSATTKTARAMRRDGTLVGMQGTVARWLFQAYLAASAQARLAVDPFLPTPPADGGPDTNVTSELVALGLPQPAAAAAEAGLASVMGTAAGLVARLAASLPLPADWQDDAVGTQAVAVDGKALPPPTAEQLRAAAVQPVLAEGDTEPCVELVWNSTVKLPAVPCAGLPLAAARPFAMAASASPDDVPGSEPWNGVVPYALPTTAALFTLPTTVKLRLRASHYAKLRALYACAALRQGADDAALAVAGTRLHTCMFSCLARYETLSGNSSGFQGAVTPGVMDTLTATLGACVEGFASPLNCYLPRFCSLFPDVDAPFGSAGSFFHFDFTAGGCFEVNPPFVNATLQAAWDRMRGALERADAAMPLKRSAAAGSGALSTSTLLLQFVFITPGWGDARWATEAAASPFCSARLSPGQGAHEYRDGTQWRSERLVWSANSSSFYFVLQSAAARAAWPLTATRRAQLTQRLATTVAGATVPLLQPLQARHGEQAASQGGN